MAFKERVLMAPSPFPAGGVESIDEGVFSSPDANARGMRPTGDWDQPPAAGPEEPLTPSKLLGRQSDVAIAFLTGHFPSEPAPWLKSAATCLVRKLDLGHHQTFIATPVNIDLNNDV